MRHSLPPVLVLAPPRYVGPLGVMRSLGRLGVRVYGLTHTRRSAPNASRFCAGTFPVGVDGRPVGSDDQILHDLVAAGRTLGEGAILIAGSDEWAVFIAEHDPVLAPVFRYPRLPASLIRELASKEGLYRLALAHGLPTPQIAFPRSRDEAVSLSASLQYPVILKPIVSRPDVLTKAVVGDAGTLLTAYRAMEETPEAPNVMFQEYVPGVDQDVWIFNGYFDEGSQCLAAFTGQKIRQHPAYMGIATLGVCHQNDTVIGSTVRFLKAVGYRGVVDIGYRFDQRDRQYKVLDVNPRLGGAFRLFVDVNGLDVVRALYRDLTGQPVPTVVPRNGRRWVKEDAELIAIKHYRRTGGLSLRSWIRSYGGLEEGATFSLTDPMPFIESMAFLLRETLGGRWRRFRSRLHPASRWRRKPTGAREAPG